MAFIDPADLDDKHYDRRYELSRAKQLVSAEFVENMKQRLKHTALQRMEAEKQVSSQAQPSYRQVCLSYAKYYSLRMPLSKTRNVRYVMTSSATL